MGYSISCISSAKIHHFKSPNLGIHGRNPSSLAFMSLPQNPRSTSTHLLPKRPFNAHFKVHHRLINRIQQYPSPNHRFTVRASAKERSDSEASSNTKLIIAFSAITVVLAVANRVLYKLALVPMKEYPFFLAQVTTFGYVAIYFSILYMRYRGRIVTDEMMAIPKSPFIMIGILEALGVAAGMSAGGHLKCFRMRNGKDVFVYFWSLPYNFKLNVFYSHAPWTSYTHFESVVEVGGDPGERRRPLTTLVTIVMIVAMDIPRPLTNPMHARTTMFYVSMGAFGTSDNPGIVATTLRGLERGEV
ncbi:CRT (chloroquine-resistance transporter)-like transporter 2 [Actinidia rufa]|uniref:CRT (Chloroquine-resistance transporter)-like transporter 2 n=1 Tax=Actinidia rufa TaxID=165716 RepID=A0A7J0EHG4_9ERIC|nr:CRT (chloroquine-resistance transporter)-like transporter 2 [Actinidia rufa]